MRDWMDGFLSRCLSGIPEGVYYDRVEKELRDHLSAQVRDLEGAGHSQPEARTLAIARMGDPAELSDRYAREWRRRLFRRGLFWVELALFQLCIVAVGILYTANAHHFGKGWPGIWGIVVGLTAAFGFRTYWALLGGTHWTIAKVSCAVLAAAQLPPIWCWMTVGGPFEMSGMMVPAWAGLLVHFLLLGWGVANCGALTRIRREEGAKTQSAL